MNRVWHKFLGIGDSPGAAAPGGTRLEFTAVPRGGEALALVAAAVAVLALLWWLYRKEGRELSKARRALMVGLRAIVLLAVGAMLVEPVLVSRRVETLPSHLAVIVDDSESMRFADPY